MTSARGWGHLCSLQPALASPLPSRTSGSQPLPCLGIQLAAHLFCSLPQPPLDGRGSGGRQGARLHGEGAPSSVLRGGILAGVPCCLSGLVGNETSHSWTMTSGGKRPNISLKFPNPRTKRTSGDQGRGGPGHRQRRKSEGEEPEDRACPPELASSQSVGWLCLTVGCRIRAI